MAVTCVCTSAHERSSSTQASAQPASSHTTDTTGQDVQPVGLVWVVCFFKRAFRHKPESFSLPASTEGGTQKEDNWLPMGHAKMCALSGRFHNIFQNVFNQIICCQEKHKDGTGRAELFRKQTMVEELGC